jgi:hypothetical protein
MTNEQIARVCHEANRGYCEAIGDSTQKPWNEAEQWQRDSALRGVEYATANPNAPASAQHDAWLADKVKDGWQYGPVKDPAKKEHPCIIPYDGLPVEQRLKDALFKAVVNALS